jgi:hypothetical protein
MLIFPQLSTGALAQYPISKQLSQRSVRSVMEDGTTIALADQAANYLRWRIAFQDLSDQEAGTISSFFAATQGNLLPFLFLDPTANLLLWSDDFSQGVWDSAGVTIDTATADPMSGMSAVRAHNSSAIDLTIAQDTQIPGLAQVCFSVYLRALTPTIAELARTAGIQSQSETAAVTNTWQRFYLSGNFPAATDPSQFSITVPAGALLYIFGPQVDSQVTPSTYVMSAGPTSNVYATARFDMSQLDVVATGPNRNSCVVFVRCNLPLENIG